MSDVCTNCDGVRCMHFVLRDWWAEDFDDCDGWCCPFCRPLEPWQIATDVIRDYHSWHPDWTTDEAGHRVIEAIKEAGWQIRT